MTTVAEKVFREKGRKFKRNAISCSGWTEFQEYSGTQNLSNFTKIYAFYSVKCQQSMFFEFQ